MHWTDRRQRFRAVLEGDQCVHPGSVFDPISARIAEELGFEVGMFAGSIASFTVLGAPDLIVILERKPNAVDARQRGGLAVRVGVGEHLLDGIDRGRGRQRELQRPRGLHGP